MKQTITNKQLSALDEPQRDTLEQWCIANEYEPNLSIGAMIAFIQEKKPLLKGISKNRFGKWFVNIDTAMLGHKDELCDSLWDATVQVLKSS
jgi:hypothetical protein